MDIMLGGWLPYRTLAGRITARSAFYRASGAYGFRDQLQDGMALSLAAPERTRAHLLQAEGRHLAEGDVRHGWLPQTGEGVQLYISSDVVWLAYAAEAHVTATGDATVLDAPIPSLEGPAVAPGAHDAFYTPHVGKPAVPPWEHGARGIDLCLARTGPLGLPLMGGMGERNDGMNRVGGGVWLGWLLLGTLRRVAPLAGARDPGHAARWRVHACVLAHALERVAWDVE